MVEFNGEDDLKMYMQGQLDACVYFRDELGIEDALQTDIGQEALSYFELSEDDV